MTSSSGSPYARGFAADAGTERALRAGLAGTEARIRRGRLAVALRSLANEPASKLVFVDLDGVPEPEVLAAARELTAVCAFGTALVAMGSTDSAYFTRTLLRCGIADYLVKPISAAAVRETCMAAEDDLPERMHAGRIVAFAGKEGSGASTLVSAIARNVASGGGTALVVDLDPEPGTLAGLLGASPAGDLSALLADLDTGGHDPEESFDLVAGPNSEQMDGVCAPSRIAGVSLVAFPSSGPVPEKPLDAAVRALLGSLANRAHAVLVAGLFDPETRTATMEQADVRVLLYEPTLASIGTAVHCLARLGPEHPAVLVQNHPRTGGSPLSRAQMRYALAERLPDVVIPFEPALHAATTGGKRRRPPGKGYRKALREVFERVIGVSAPAAA